MTYVRSAPRDLWARDLAMFLELRDTVHARPEVLSRCNRDDLKLLDEKVASSQAT